jgi:hypothetical protein
LVVSLGGQGCRWAFAPFGFGYLIRSWLLPPVLSRIFFFFLSVYFWFEAFLELVDDFIAGFVPLFGGARQGFEAAPFLGLGADFFSGAQEDFDVVIEQGTVVWCQAICDDSAEGLEVEVFGVDGSRVQFGDQVSFQRVFWLVGFHFLAGFLFVGGHGNTKVFSSACLFFVF